MTKRTIVTSQPDVACDVCERRLLRGEQPDVFLAAGRRRIVCELCAPRAAHEGWLRETDSQSVSLPPLRPRRGRTLFERLPVPFRVSPSGGRTLKGAPPSGAHADRRAGSPAAGVGGEPAQGPSSDGEHPEGQTVTGAPLPEARAGSQEPYELLGGYTRARAEPVQAARRISLQDVRDAPEDPASGGDRAVWAVSSPSDATALVELESGTRAGPAASPSYVEQALAVFNASEFPRRVAGVARSLGAPEVNVRSAEHLDSVVSIVVAWELCWYRYEVDLSEPAAEAQAIAQGTELRELAREDRLANAAASESGTLVLAGI